MSATQQIPPISFVKKYLQKRKITGRVSDIVWRQVTAAWTKLSPAEKTVYRKKPLAGLNLPRTAKSGGVSIGENAKAA